jgi:chromosomal replication initiation ATPase DnaA
VTAVEIIAEESAAVGVTPKQVLGPLKWKRYVVARQRIASRLLDMGWSYCSIGQALNRHHTTIMSYFRERP